MKSGSMRSRSGPIRWSLCALLFAAALLSACASTSTTPNADRRTAELRAAFQPGRATRRDVAARWGDSPQIAWTRPSLGWTNRFVIDTERRVGTPIARAEKFVGPTGTSAGLLSLEHVWFFYDADDVVIDVVWERMGD